MTDTVYLPKSVQAFGTEAFPERLRAELAAQSLRLPLDDYCRGEALVPLEPDLELGVHDSSDTGDRLHVVAFIAFTGRVPSYCADHTHVEPAMGLLRISIDKQTGAAGFETDPLGA